LIGVERLFPLLEQFFREPCGTEVKLITEVYGGSWDALVAGRADLSIGAPGEAPPGGGYSVRPMGLLEFVFAVAPQHPLAQFPEPLTSQAILQYRAISAADSSRHLAPRTSGLLTGQEVLTVPDMRAKLAAHIAGLGVGYLPLRLAREAVQAGQLVIKQVEEVKPSVALHLAWRTDHAGRALMWFLDRLEREDLLPA